MTEQWNWGLIMLQLGTMPAFGERSKIRDPKSEYLRGKTRDILEERLDHFKKSLDAYYLAATLFPNEFAMIECLDKNDILSIPEVHALIIKELKRRFKLPLKA